VRSGEFVSSCLSSGRAGFWPIALDLLSLYPDNKIVRRNIGAAASHMNHTIVGPMSEHYTRCAGAIEEILNSQNMSSSTRSFLQELAANLRKASHDERRDEEDESLNW
jgi:uncharacterized protein (UPF0147 family)